MSDNLSSFLERKLKALTANKFVKVPTEKSYIQRVRDAVIAANSMAERVSIEVNGVDVTQQHLNAAKIPLADVFKNAAPTIFVSHASEDSRGSCKTFTIEVT